MKNQVRINEPVTVATITTLVSIALPLLKTLFGRSVNQTLIANLNQETATLEPIVNALLEKYSFLKNQYGADITRTMQARDGASGRGKNPHEYDLNCLYRAVIISAQPFEPSLAQIQLLDNKNSQWACIDWNGPKDFTQFLPVVQQNQQAGAGAGSGAQSTQFLPNQNFLYLALLGLGYYLFKDKISDIL